MEETLDFNLFSDSTEILEGLHVADDMERFNRLESDWLKVESEYKDLLWRFRDLNQNHATNILFIFSNEIKDQQTKYEELIKSLKSWTIYHLENQYSIKNLNAVISIISNAVEISGFFDISKIGIFEQKFFDDKYHKNYNSFKASKINQFNDFSTVTIPSDYLELIFAKFYEGANVKNGMRTLPTCKDTLKFSLIIDDYFEKNKDEGYLFYFPIYFWWKFTNIIPMRINEFCLVKRNALVQNKNSYYIEIPRSKGNMNRTIRYEKIKIPNKLAEKIKEYLELTETDHKSVTLINYNYLHQKRNSYNVRNEDTTYFNKGNFRSLLIDFHKSIIFERYGFKLQSVDEDPTNVSNRTLTKMLNPNDTRYFALFNLMLQGYHPSEIEKLAGHKDIYSQYSYHQHIKYWTDSDLFYLYLNNNEHLDSITSNFFKQSFIKEKVINSELTSSNIKIPLSIGYCTDFSQNCMVEEHYLCEHWRITKEEYHKHQNVIDAMIQQKESDFKLLMDKLLDLHKTSIFKNQSYEYAGNNPDYLYKLKENANQIKDALYKLSQLKEKLGI